MGQRLGAVVVGVVLCDFPFGFCEVPPSSCGRSLFGRQHLERGSPQDEGNLLTAVPLRRLGPPSGLPSPAGGLAGVRDTRVHPAKSRKPLPVCLPSKGPRWLPCMGGRKRRSPRKTHTRAGMWTGPEEVARGQGKDSPETLENQTAQGPIRPGFQSHTASLSLGERTFSGCSWPKGTAPKLNSSCPPKL